MRVVFYLLGMGLFACAGDNVTSQPDAEAPFTPILDGFCDPAEPPPSAKIELGLNVDESFVTLSPQQEVPLEFGVQGGQHITVAARFYFDAELPSSQVFSLSNTTGTERIGNATINTTPCDGAWTVRNARVFVFSPMARTATLTVSLRPRGGDETTELATDKVVLRLIDTR